jgi:hypothetical protein
MPKRPRLKVIGGNGPRAIKASVAEASAELATSLAVVPAEPREDKPRVHLRTIQPSGSKTDLLFACSWPWYRKAPVDDVGEGAKFGSAFHALMDHRFTMKRDPKLGHIQNAADKWGVSDEKLAERYKTAAPVLLRWLEGDNMWGLNFMKGMIASELSVAFDPASGRTRLIEGPTEDTHEYTVDEGCIPATIDFMSAGPRRRMLPPGVHPNPEGGDRRVLLILDHKSGWDVAADWQPKTPAENGQLRTLATAFNALQGDTPFDLVIVAFFHAPAIGLPQVYADVLTREDMWAHQKELAKALKRAGNDWMRPGDWCSYCPGWAICPTNTTSLTELKRPPGPLNAIRVGAIHQAMNEYNRLADRLRGEIRHWVEVNGPGIRPDGQEVALVSKDVERLSKEGIIKAMGPLKGGKLLEQLRVAGAMTTTTQIELRAVRR